MKPVKVIFLDCDGVLNTSNPEDYKHAKKNSREYSDIYLPRCVDLLNEITANTGAKIVVSSVWRLGETVESMQKIFNGMGITGEVIGLTPLPDKYTVRGIDIDRWMKLTKDNFKIINYVILDDDSDMLYNQRHHFFNVDHYNGITPTIVHKVTRFLNGEF